MAKIILYSAISLNFKIADKNGSVEWLESIDNPSNSDFGYAQFYKTIEATLMGYNTYAQLKSWDVPFPYPDKKNYVFTSRKELEEDEYVEFIHERQEEFIVELKANCKKDIWLVGGGTLNSSLLENGLIDELQLHLIPTILDGGIDLFVGEPRLNLLKLQDVQPYENGIVELKYECLKH